MRAGKAAWLAYPTRLIINGEEVKSVDPAAADDSIGAVLKNNNKKKGQRDLRSNCNASVVRLNVHWSLVSKLNKLRDHDIVMLSETWANDKSKIELTGYDQICKQRQRQKARKRDSIGMELLLRIPMHEIAAICYIKDDQQHILAIKFGSIESCKLALLYCENKLLAEQICALVGQCFNLVYTEATVYLIERQLSPAERPGSTSSGTVSTLVQNRPPDLSSYYSASVANYPRVPSDSESLRNSDSGAGKELLEDYMTKLTSKLSPEELRRFLLHLDDWKKENHFPEFCDDVLAMLGQERKQLLSELLPFIPAENFQYFEDFLRRNDIRLLENSSTFSGSQTNLRNYPTRRSLSEVSTTSSVSNTAASGEALDNLLDYSNNQYNIVDVEMGGKTFDMPEDY
ncbi:cerebral cavernous malformations 2 protein [Elysia marginata]|uniref:Cerebral cavernous malformations 2 protein n=1 Tax=Elysia marginata TaxID=1093978 RepID=A0AAV4GYS0_9GAST|nr:cerebral cavernous malformations 2 protein [Elysia marginata]